MYKKRQERSDKKLLAYIPSVKNEEGGWGYEISEQKIVETKNGSFFASYAMQENMHIGKWWGNLGQ